MRTIVWIFIFSICFGEYSKGQEQVYNPPLTKAQMLEDFDFLYDKVEKVFPEISLRKEVSGTDILADIRDLRQYIDTVPCERDFFNIITKALFACKNQHCWFTNQYPFQDRDSVEIQESIQYIMNMGQYYELGMDDTCLITIYLNGDYYLIDIMEDEEIVIPHGSILKEINGIDIDEYVYTWVLPIHDEPRWDNENEKYYVRYIYPPQKTGMGKDFTLTYSYQGEIKNIKLESYEEWFPPVRGYLWSPVVSYFGEDRILYVRIPAMNMDFADYLKEEITKYNNTQVKKVVLDVRGNGGGNDMLWIEVLSNIMDKPVSSPQLLAVKNNELVKEYMQKLGIDPSEVNPGNQLLTIGGEEFFCLPGEREIPLSENSILYDGTIYILFDHGCFSSTLALKGLCANEERLVSVGSADGYIGGQGIAPLSFILPNSKLLFTLPWTVDATGVKGDDPYEYFHNNTEIPVYQTFDEYYRARTYQGEMYGRDFLYNVDKVFQTVLALP